ncbi:SDR family oxidoreductase [Puerhibacterium sp. TATVAM-FAB25]|uniref:SDR family oxidoreductase n=1 Tax=Puerhibacterium sp. TATVAM-FAB25 TaxID=3093699 RepID=UPI003978816D
MTSSGGSLRGVGALVTGATSGLGRAVAIRLAQAGADVGLLGRGEHDLGRAAAQVESHGVRAVPLRVDLADTERLDEVVQVVATELGGLGILVNAAATDAPGSAEELSVQDWQRVVAVNLTAPFVLARSAMPHMRRGGGGLVVNVSSVAGRRGWAGASAYCATKFALTGLTQSLAAEGRADGIRVCVVYPGAMATSWGAFDPAQRTAPERPAHERQSLDPDVVADLIAWMAASPGEPVLNEVTVTPLLEGGWP